MGKNKGTISKGVVTMLNSSKNYTVISQKRKTRGQKINGKKDLAKNRGNNLYLFYFKGDIMAIKGELLKEYTKNQLVNCGRVGMYRFGEVLHLTPEQAETIVENNEILYINKHEMHEFGVNRMIYKRDEIRKDKDSLPYCGRFEFFGGDEFITIQEIHKETVKCKLIGPKEIIQKIKDNKELNTVNENMSDDEFAAANADLLNEVKYVKGYFNKPRDEVDTQGLHISKIEDYDNYA